VDTNLAQLNMITSDAHRVQDEALTQIDQGLERLEKLVSSEWPQERAQHRDRFLTIANDHLVRIVAKDAENVAQDVNAVEQHVRQVMDAFGQVCLCDFEVAANAQTLKPQKKKAQSGFDDCASAAATSFLAWERIKREETEALRTRIVKPLMQEIERVRLSVQSSHALTKHALDKLAQTAAALSLQSQADLEEAKVGHCPFLQPFPKTLH